MNQEDVNAVKPLLDELVSMHLVVLSEETREMVGVGPSSYMERHADKVEASLRTMTAMHDTIADDDEYMDLSPALLALAINELAQLRAATKATWN